MKKLFDELRKSVVTVGSGSDYGTGFFVSPGFIVTCAHVILNDPENIRIKYSGQWFDASLVEATDPVYPDLALLSVSSGALVDHHCALLYDEISITDKVYSFGYHSTNKQLEPVSLEYEGEIPFESSFTSGSDFKSYKFKFGHVVPGYSGSPIMNLQNGMICGIIDITRDRSSPMGGKGIPVSTLYYYFPFIKEQNVNYHLRFDYWTKLLAPQVHDIYKQQQLNLGEAESKGLRTKRKLERQITQIGARFVAGSHKIRVRDILSGSFDIQFDFSPYRHTKGSNITLVSSILAEIEQGELKSNYLVLSDPGNGKSTLANTLFFASTTLYLEDKSEFVPILIDLKDFSGEEGFGTKEWFAELLNDWGVANDAQQIKTFIVLDSLDEYLADCKISEIHEKLNLFLFGKANVILVRTQFFERFLPMSDFDQEFENVYLNTWNPDYREEYTKWYVKYCWSELVVEVDNIIERISSSKSLSELSDVPLRYNMLLEIILDNNLNFDLVDGLLPLYSNYIFKWISRESSKLSNLVLGVEEKYHLITRCAWQFYDEGRIGDDFENIQFSISELRKLIANENMEFGEHSLDDILSDLLFRSILRLKVASSIGISPFAISFVHKSYQEFFVAKHLFASLSGGSSESYSGFERFISQEVAQFLKEYLKTISDDLRMLGIITNNCIEAIRLSLSGNPNLKQPRLVRYQLAYYLGHINSDRSIEFLESLVQEEEDELVKRSTIIGLAFGGQPKLLEDYILALREEEDPKVRNGVNIGAQLSYFGDQPLNPLAPEIDQGLPSCRNTVSKLIYQLRTAINKNSWQLDLYTILYLWKHRKRSSHSLLATVSENIAEFELAIKIIESDLDCSTWPEIPGAKQLIKDVKDFKNKE